jgi:glycosyltransferase involved in cell wall biosynthesis
VAAPDVALIAPYPQVGVRHGGMSGVASYASNLAHALADAGAEVEVVAPLDPGQPARREHDGPVRVRRAFPRSSAGAPHALRAALRTGAPVVHLQHEFFLYGGPASTPSLVLALHGLRARRRRSLATLHQVVDPTRVDRGFTELHRVRVPTWAARGGLSAMQRAMRRGADRILVHEPAFARVVPGAEVVPHGIEPDAHAHDRAPAQRASARAQARRALGLGEDRLCVLCFGFLAPYKGLETVLEAAALAGPAIELVVAGGEHPRLVAGGDRYHRSLHEHYGAHARFTGRVADEHVARWFLAADLAAFMYPQPFSSSGALALALAHRTPVLVSPELADTAALPASLAAPREPAALARRMRALAHDPAAREGLREATAGIARERAWPAVAARHLELYEEVRRGPRTARR